MRLRRFVGAVAVSLVSTLTAGCSAQVPSGQPAVDALVDFYDQSSGVWPTTGWWNSANALTALTDYMIATGDQRYLWVLGNTYAKKRAAGYGNFTNYLIDDSGWWALAWIRAYDLTGDRQYLQTARAGVEFMWKYQDDTCGGGLWWSTNRQYKNAIANELFIQAAAELDSRLGGGSVYLPRAIAVWKWFDGSGMINDHNLVNDGLNTGTCTNNGGTEWSYNQGVALGALVALAGATKDEEYLRRARELADASTAAAGLHVDGVLTEPCEDVGCGIDGPSFKGIYVRNLGILNRRLTDHPYQDYLELQATTAYDKDRAAGDQYGLHWAGPLAGINGATQQSIVDLFVAARPIEDGDRASSTEPTPTQPTPTQPTPTGTGSSAGEPAWIESTTVVTAATT